MFRYLIPAILIGIAVTGFFMFTKPFYADITDLKNQVASYNEALNNSKELESARDELTKKYNSIDPENLVKIVKLLPDNVDNIRLILEIGNIASPYGMVLRDVKYDTTDKNNTQKLTTLQMSQQIEAKQSSKDYGTWNLEFSTDGTYTNFLNFIKDLEKNLRIVDISSIEFFSDVAKGGEKGVNILSSNSYKYNFKIKTYWLKN